MRRPKKLIVSILMAVSAAVFLAPATGSQAMECIGVKGVASYCPGRHCIKQPCLRNP